MTLGVPANAVTSNSTGGVTEMIVTLPTHSEDDLLVIHIGQDDIAATGFTNPTGWSDVVPFFQNQFSAKVIAKIAGASEPGTVTVTSDDSERFTAIAYKVTGADLPETAPTPGTGDSSTATCPTTTPVSSTNLIIWGAFTNGLTVPHSMVTPTKIADITYSSSCTTSAFYEVWNSTSATGTDDITLTGGNNWGGLTFIIPELSAGDDLEADSIKTTPVVGTPSIGQDHELDAAGIKTTPVAETPSAGQTHILSAAGIIAAPVVGTPTIGQEHVLTAVGLLTTPETEGPTIGQSHILSAAGIIAAPVVGTPAIGQSHVLSALGLVVAPVVEVVSIGQTHILTSEGIITTPTVGQPTVTQGHPAESIETIPVVGAPTLGQTHALVAVGTDTIPVVGTPVVGSIHVLDALGITIVPVTGAPALGTVHALTATGIIIIPEVGAPVVTKPATDLVWVVFTPVAAQVACTPFAIKVLYTVFIS